MHIGTIAYFKRIAEYLNKIKDDCVLYEGIGGDTPEIKKYISLLKEIASIMGFITQHEMEYKKGWVNSDITYKELVSINGGELFDGKFDGDSDILKTNPKIIKSLIKFVLNSRILFKSPINDNVLIGLRNSHVIRDVFKVLEKENEVAIFYGNGHRKGIDKFLKSLGFKSTMIGKYDPFEK